MSIVYPYIINKMQSLDDEERGMLQYILHPENWGYFDGSRDEEKYNIRSGEIYIFLHNLRKTRKDYELFASKISAELRWHDRDYMVLTLEKGKDTEGTLAHCIYSLHKYGRDDELYLESVRFVDFLMRRDVWIKVGERTYRANFPDPKYEHEAYTMFTVYIPNLSIGAYCAEYVSAFYRE